MTIKSPPKQRRFAIADVHGCSRTLRQMVEDVLQLKPVDTLFLLGDCIDRGPDSKGVLNYLLQLRESGYDIQAIRGNHEEMLLCAVTDQAARNIWYGNGGWATLREFGVDSPEAIPRRYLDYIASLPYILTTEDYVFVHAGLDFTTDNPLQDTPSQFMLWARNYQIDPAKLGSRTLITGHTVTPLFAIRELLESNHITLDNGCFDQGEMAYGSLVALDLDTRQLLVQENIE